MAVIKHMGARHSPAIFGQMAEFSGVSISLSQGQGA